VHVKDTRFSKMIAVSKFSNIQKNIFGSK